MKLGNPFDQGVIYHEARNIVFRENPLTVVEYHEFSFLNIKSAILFNSELIKVLISSILPLHPRVNEHIWAT